MIELAGPNEFAGGTVIRLLAAATACMALVPLALGAFSVITGRLPTIRGPHGNWSPEGRARRLGLAQVLSGIALLILGVQPFLSLTWLSRIIFLALAVVLAAAGAILLFSVLFRAGARNA